ncbi:MFS transporter [Streptomyces sp. MUM 203J]|uniref:MFS transporter n=1 Tax=Streptomyces sp. MUM 203J TaxID=2791990 RepID=UPI001F03DFB4|nr:MFS transporter [Streptomyces sp. MUM 203J]MCH0539042.1 MFS transporter [Streptomyces sp. MUM 203J]
MRTAAPPPPATGRRGSGDFRLFWCANTTDTLGTQTSGLALPLLLLALGESPAVVGTVAGVAMGLGILVGPFAAVLADRGARKRVMVLCALASAGAMGSVAAAAALDRLTLGHLLAALLAERTATACQEAAAAGTVAAVVPPDRYPHAVSRLQAGEQLALVAGPVLGGVLFQLSRWLPFLADAVSYAVSALCVSAMRSDLRPADGRGGAGDPKRPADGPSTGRPEGSEGAAPGTAPRGRALLVELGAGLSLARRTPLLRLVLLWSVVMSGVLSALGFGTIFTLRGAGAGGVTVGAVLAVAGAAGLAGALAAPRLARALPGARLVVTVTCLLVPLAALLAATGRVWVYGLLFGAIALLLPGATVVLQARAVRVIPPRLQARTGTVLTTATGLSAALAPVAAGALASLGGAVWVPLGCAAVLAALAVRTAAVAPRLLRRGTP